MSDPTVATPSVRFGLRRLSPALLLSLGALACRPTIESDKSFGDLYGEDSGGADGADGAVDSGGEDTGDDGDDIDIAPPVIYDCDTAPTTDFTGTPWARTMMGVSPIPPPMGALPAPTCLATSTPPLATRKFTFRPSRA